MRFRRAALKFQTNRALLFTVSGDRPDRVELFPVAEGNVHPEGAIGGKRHLLITDEQAGTGICGAVHNQFSVGHQPEGAGPHDATAGFTAAESVDALERAGLQPGDGPVLVTGATGGVGSVAVGMLAKRGYEVVASTGKASSVDWLKSIGASSVIDRAETSAEHPKPLETERWAGAVDCVGGSTLAYVLRTLKYGAAVAASGLTGGSGLNTTVLPFILRNISLLGIDSVQTPMPLRRSLWQRIDTDLRPQWLDTEVPEIIGLNDLPLQLDKILAGQMQGRVLVDPNL